MIVDSDIWPGESSGSWLCFATDTSTSLQPLDDKADPVKDF